MVSRNAFSTRFCSCSMMSFSSFSATRSRNRLKANASMATARRLSPTSTATAASYCTPISSRRPVGVSCPKILTAVAVPSAASPMPFSPFTVTWYLAPLASSSPVISNLVARPTSRNGATTSPVRASTTCTEYLEMPEPQSTKSVQHAPSADRLACSATSSHPTEL